MKKFYTLLFSFVFSFLFAFSASAAVNVSGTLSGNVSWGADPDVYITGDVTVSGNLTIMAGTTITVADHVMITVNSTGSVEANGTQGNEILFTSEDPSAGWRGIYFKSGTGDDPASSFRYCTFEYGNADGSTASTNSGGIISLSYHSDVSFSNCTFQNNKASSYGGAINAAYSGLNISQCLFKNNSAGGYDGGGAIRVASGDGHELKIENSTFFNNSAYTGGALIAEGADGLVVSGCIFANNEANFGGAVTISQSSNNISFYANTFACNKVNNSDAIICVGSIQGFAFVNNIISGFGTDLAMDFDGSYADDVVFENCLIEGGESSVRNLPSGYTWTEMADADPVFSSPSSAIGLAGDGSSADWQLNSESPCINAGPADISALGLPGNDLAGSDRVQQGRIDIGALESVYVSTSAFRRQSNVVDFNIWFRRDIKEIVVQTDDSSLRFTGVLYDISGVLVNDKRKSFHQSMMEFSTAGFHHGIYVVKVLSSTGKVLKISKIIVN